MKIALATLCLNQTFRKSLQVAARLAARGVQFDVLDELKPGDLTDTGRRQLLHLLDELGLSVASLALSMQGSYFDETRLDANVTVTRAAIEFARQLRTDILDRTPGKGPGERLPILPPAARRPRRPCTVRRPFGCDASNYADARFTACAPGVDLDDHDRAARS